MSNPFDTLADEALREYEDGETQDIRDIANEWGINLEWSGSDALAFKITRNT